MWGELGFKVKVDVVKPTRNLADADAVIYTDNFQKKYDNGEFDVIAIDMTMLSPDAFSALSQFAVEFSGNGVDMNSPNYDLYGHVTGYNSKEYNEKIDAAFAEKDRAARATILHEAEEMLLEDMPVVPLIFLQDAYLASDVLSGIETTYYGTQNFKKVKMKDYMEYKARTAETKE